MVMEQLVEKYFRPGRLPHIWCPGCGNGIITGAIVKAIDKQGLDKIMWPLFRASAAPAVLPVILILIREIRCMDGRFPLPAD